MAGSSINRRLARTVLEDLLENDLLPTLEPTKDLELPTASIVERILEVGVVKIERANTREHGEVIRLTLLIPDDPTD